MWFFSPQYNVKNKTDALLVAETGSGRAVWALLAAVLILTLFPRTLPDFALAAVLLVGLTYRRQWTIDVAANKISGRMYLLFFSFEDTVINLNSIVEVSVKYCGGQEHDYRIYFIDSGGDKTWYAWRASCNRLVPIMKDLKHYLPNTVTYSLHHA